MENKIPFYRNVSPTGNSIGISIPKEIADYLGFKKGDELTIIVDTNKKGQNYMAVYKEEEKLSDI